MSDRVGKGVSAEQRRRDGRLAWIVVGTCALLSLALIVLGVMALRGPAARWAEESMRETRDQVARERGQEEAWRNLPVPPTAPSLADTARPIGNVASWVGPDSYPTGALRRGQQGRVRVTVAIDENGRATGCSTHLSSGYTSLDYGTCSVMMRHGRWEPAGPGEIGVRRWTSPPIRWVLPE
ncbi:MAG: TonB family protein [Sphingomonas bacterium]|uniref:energy transducer TonB n=1 Tax=Sphingomonas bacterium TaxID=1895847 RepID=UPI00261344E8|nr:energy transducer TonB [Sphingomonas bacterium]MDB5695313.1 TonB family protein [Sphingomonas bacterium]